MDANHDLEAARTRLFDAFTDWAQRDGDFETVRAVDEAFNAYTEEVRADERRASEERIAELEAAVADAESSADAQAEIREEQTARAEASEERERVLREALEHVESDLHLLAGKVSGRTLDEVRAALASLQHQEERSE